MVNFNFNFKMGHLSCHGKDPISNMRKSHVAISNMKRNKFGDNVLWGEGKETFAKCLDFVQSAQMKFYFQLFSSDWNTFSLVLNSSDSDNQEQQNIIAWSFSILNQPCIHRSCNCCWGKAAFCCQAQHHFRHLQQISRSLAPNSGFSQPLTWANPACACVFAQP